MQIEVLLKQLIVILLPEYLKLDSTNLEDIVDESKERGERKGCGEHGDETILNHKLQILVKQCELIPSL